MKISELLLEKDLMTLKNGSTVFVDPTNDELSKLFKETTQDGSTAEFRFAAIGSPSGQGRFFIWNYLTIHEDAINQLKTSGLIPKRVSYNKPDSVLTGTCIWDESSNPPLKFERAYGLEFYDELILDLKKNRNADIQMFLENQLNLIANKYQFIEDWLPNFKDNNPILALKSKFKKLTTRK